MDCTIIITSQGNDVHVAKQIIKEIDKSLEEMITSIGLCSNGKGFDSIVGLLGRGTHAV